MVPSSCTSIRSAAGLFGRPGIVIIEPAIATRKPAPADTYASLIFILYPVGRPRSF